MRYRLDTHSARRISLVTSGFHLLSRFNLPSTIRDRLWLVVDVLNASSALKYAKVPRWLSTLLLISWTVAGARGICYGQDPIPEHFEAAHELDLIESEPEYRLKIKWKDVYLFDVVKGVERRLTNTAMSEDSPELSDDGNLLAFSSNKSIFVLDLQANRSLLELDAEQYSTLQWIRGTGKIVAHHRGKGVLSSEGKVSRYQELIAMNPDGTKKEVLQGRCLRIGPYRCHPTEARIAFVRERLSDGVRELCVMAYGEAGSPKVIRTFEKGMYPKTIHWLSGGQRLAVLVLSSDSVTARNNSVFSVDLLTGTLETLFRANIHEGDFAISMESSRIALADNVSPFGWVAENGSEIPETVTAPGQEVQWYKGERYVLYTSYRLPDDLKERLRVGFPLQDTRMFIVLDGGGVACLTDEENKHSLYVKPEKIIQNGGPTSVLVDIDIEEAQAWVDQYDKWVKLGPDGPEFKNGLRLKHAPVAEN